MQSQESGERKQYVIALAGNPNVGKSTLFNELTGMRQHTGNWAGKTVESALGKCDYKEMEITLVDLPGIYSLSSESAEEKAAKDFICNEHPDAVIVVCDSTSLERSLVLALQIKAMGQKLLFCAGLKDEAEKRKISIDFQKLSELINSPVVSISARNKDGIDELMEKLYSLLSSNESDETLNFKKLLEDIESTVKLSEKICSYVVSRPSEEFRKERKIDRIILGKYTGFPILFLLLGIVLWITISGANYPSQLLQKGFTALGEYLHTLMINAPEWLSGVLLDGIYKVLTWVVAVMLPPMAIFFPLFTLLEDSGFLPRIAFLLDKRFQCAGACGKQALTMWSVAVRMRKSFHLCFIPWVVADGMQKRIKPNHNLCLVAM